MSYDLRHAFALSYLRNGGDTLSLQRIMGHTDLTMTKRYVAYTLGDIKEQHAHVSPVNKLVPARHEHVAKDGLNLKFKYFSSLQNG
jgi:integrase